MPPTYLNHIGGEWRPASDGSTTPDVNPARTDEVVAVFPSAARDDAVQAVEGAARAFPGWSSTPMPKRGEILLRAAALFEQRLDEVAEALTREEGKTLAESKGEAARGVSPLRYSAGEAMQPTGEKGGGAHDRRGHALHRPEMHGHLPHGRRLGIPAAEQRSRSVATIPLDRYGAPEEFARAAAFLLSDAASYVTGATLQVDGGMIRSVL